MNNELVRGFTAAIVSVTPCYETYNLHEQCDVSSILETSNELMDKNFGMKQLSPFTLLENKTNDIGLDIELKGKQKSTFQYFIDSLMNEVINDCRIAEEIGFNVHDEDSVRIHLNYKDVIHDIVIYEDGNIFCSYAGKNIEPKSNFIQQNQIDYTKLVSQFSNYSC